MSLKPTPAKNSETGLELKFFRQNTTKKGVMKESERRRSSIQHSIIHGQPEVKQSKVKYDLQYKSKQISMSYNHRKEGSLAKQKKALLQKERTAGLMKEDADQKISEDPSDEQTDSSDLDAFSETKELSGRHANQMPLKPKINVNADAEVHIPLSAISNTKEDDNNLINEISTAEKGCGDSFNNN